MRRCCAGEGRSKSFRISKNPAPHLTAHLRAPSGRDPTDKRRPWRPIGLPSYCVYHDYYYSITIGRAYFFVRRHTCRGRPLHCVNPFGLYCAFTKCGYRRRRVSDTPVSTLAEGAGVSLIRRNRMGAVVQRASLALFTPHSSNLHHVILYAEILSSQMPL